jgi:NTE family protein
MVLEMRRPLSAYRYFSCYRSLHSRLSPDMMSLEIELFMQDLDHPSPMQELDLTSRRSQGRPPFECIALLLQGGGALGAYQAGVYEALSEVQLQPDWVAGISIGAINAALIAGNPPEQRVEKLRKFWQLVTENPVWGTLPNPAESTAQPLRGLMDQMIAMSAMSMSMATAKPTAELAEELRNLGQRFLANPFAAWLSDPEFFAPRGELARGFANQMSAGLALMQGASAFFRPRSVFPWLQAAGTLEATSYYDTAALKTTLERLVDFDRINAGKMRFSVGAVNVGTGNFVYFDNTTHTIGPEHVMASGALPPGFPAIEIEGEHYWDGGLVSNTPLQWVLDSEPRQDTLAFQVDLWNARGTFPCNMAEVTTRQKEIQYSSRTRADSDHFRYVQKIRNALSQLLERLPEDLKSSPEFSVLDPVACHKVYNLVQLIYRSKEYEGDSKDYEFSRASMEDHWRAGYHDTIRTLRHPEVLQRPKNSDGISIFDLAQDGRE